MSDKENPKNHGTSSDEELMSQFEAFEKIISSGDPRQHEIVDEMSEMLRERLGKRDQEEGEREKLRHPDIKAFIRTQKGGVVGVVLKESQFKIILPQDTFSEQQIAEALQKTYPEYEYFENNLPSHFPAEFIAAARTDGFLGVRNPTPKLKPHIKAFWLTVNKQSTDAEEMFDVDENGDLQFYFLSWHCANVELEPEVPNQQFQAADGSLQAYSLNKYHLSGQRRVPFIPEIQARLGAFLGNLFSEDKIESLSVKYSGWEIPMTAKEAHKHKGFREVHQERLIKFDHGQVEEQRRNIERRRMYLFESGINETGILEDRQDEGYLLPFVYTRVKSFPGGIGFDQLDDEIERLRWA